MLSFLKRYATALQHHHILYANNLLWPVVSSKRRVTTAEFGAENRFFLWHWPLLQWNLPLCIKKVSFFWQSAVEQLDSGYISKKMNKHS